MEEYGAGEDSLFQITVAEEHIRSGLDAGVTAILGVIGIALTTRLFEFC